MIFVLQGCDFHSSGVPYPYFKNSVIGTAFVEKWINAVGFSTSLFLDFNKPCILQFPQGVDRFLPAAVEQLHHFIDGIIEIDPAVIVCPSVFSGKVCPSEDICVQYLCFIADRLKGWCFKQEVRELRKAQCFFLLMDIHKPCHCFFCGQLELCFPGYLITNITDLGFVSEKPCKRLSFRPLTFHA